MSGFPKIIFIYHRSYPDWFPSPGEDLWYRAGHTGLIAAYLKQFAPYLEIENWRPDATQRTYSERIVSGVLCRVFPSRWIPVFGDFSPTLLARLAKAIGTSDNTIIHYGGVSSGQFFYVLSRHGSKIRIIGNHQGDRLRSMRHDLRALPRKQAERHLLKRAHHYLCAGRTTMKCLSSLAVRDECISFPEIGIDMGVFHPIDQLQARQVLGLPLDRPLILYIGRADYHKGLSRLLDAMPSITSQIGAELVCVGCFPDDPLYARLQSMRIRHWPYVGHHSLPLFHNASDVFVRASPAGFGPLSVGVNVAEALACGTPVVSATLLEHPDYDRYREGIGIARFDDVAGAVLTLIRDGKRARATMCQEAARSYAWETWLTKLIKVYFGEGQATRERAIGWPSRGDACNA